MDIGKCNGLAKVRNASSAKMDIMMDKDGSAIESWTSEHRTMMDENVSGEEQCRT